MLPYQENFIRFALKHNVLKFGEFTLKSGRLSPYFFNAGLFNDGHSLAKIAQFYVQTLIEKDEKNFMLYGPAYKGIPIACACAMAYSTQYDITVPFAFNRKEIKDHGEGGQLVGAPLSGRVIIVDDVITAGLSIGESIDVIRANQAEVGAVLIGLDRQEKTLDSDLSAVLKVQQKFSIPVHAVISMDLLIEYLATENKYNHHLEKMYQYRESYGVKL